MDILTIGILVIAVIIALLILWSFFCWWSSECEYNCGTDGRSLKTDCEKMCVDCVRQTINAIADEKMKLYDLSYETYIMTIAVSPHKSCNIKIYGDIEGETDLVLYFDKFVEKGTTGILAGSVPGGEIKKNRTFFIEADIDTQIKVKTLLF